jgi:hypothetical protein
MDVVQRVGLGGFKLHIYFKGFCIIFIVLKRRNIDRPIPGGVGQAFDCDKIGSANW